jgi:sec-independent protein translocase protein TatA
MLALGPLGIGPFELILILAVVVIIFGVGRLPEVGGAIGKSIREFRRSAKEPEGERRQLSEPEARSDVETPASKAPPAAESTVSCPQCGTSNAADTKFCSECGTSLQARVN